MQEAMCDAGTCGTCVGQCVGLSRYITTCAERDGTHMDFESPDREGDRGRGRDRDRETEKERDRERRKQTHENMLVDALKQSTS